MTKKYILLLAAAFLMTTAGLAQQGWHRVSNLHCNNTLPIQVEHSTTQKSADRQAKATPQLAPTAGPNRLIGDQPTGEHYYYSRSGNAYLYYFNLYNVELNGSVSEMFFDDFGNVYLKNIITQYNRLSATKYDSWLEGNVDEGTVSFQLPQPVMTLQGTTYYATLMNLDQQQKTYVKASDQTLVLNYDETTGDVTPQPGSPFTTGQMVVGLTDLAGQWTGFADWNIDLRRVNDTTVEGPDTQEGWKQYTITAGGFEGALGNVFITGSDIYVQGVCPSLPEAWLKGTISGDKVTFPSGQFLGGDMTNDRFLYFFSATTSTSKNEEGQDVTTYTLNDNPVTFDYDAATGSLTGGSLFVVNNGKRNGNPAYVYNQAKIQPFAEKAATPVAPLNLTLYEGNFNDYNSGYGWGHMEFNLPNADTEGNYLIPEKLSYALYVRVNGEERQLKLYSSDYQNQTEPVIDEIPYTYGDDWDIFVRGQLRSVYYFVLGPEAYGVQAIYRGGGEEHRSDIAWVSTKGLGADVQPEAATPSYPDIDPNDVGGEIKFTPLTGGETRGYFGNWKAKTYDVAMKVQDEALTGSYIEEITFPLIRAQNISSIKVWLSSQLRVENGQNVADLASYDIATIKAGNITVKLDKPYVIPAEGVYVGYTLTITENTFNSQNGPIRTITKAKPSGFYIHNNTDLLKWMNFAEPLDISAMIELKLGGSKVKGNAVTPLDGESMFVRTGTDVTPTLTFVNHGANGIKSLDVECTLNGQTSQYHITPKSAVVGTFGLSTQQKLTLPAFSERGTYDMTLRVVKVNDQPNEDADNEATQRFIAINGDPKHRPLLEEYTGTWCGWCPRGFVALEKLAKLYPDDYVCVAYHNNDPMEITTQFPSAVSGFPRGWIDRGLDGDPYYGTSGNKNFGILDDLKWRASQFGVADIDISASLSDDEKRVDVTTNVLFPFSNDKANYALEYLLVADGLSGEGSGWQQSNYYSGQNYGSDMAEFQRSGDHIDGLVFNDVVVMLSQYGGIDGSIPEKVSAEEPVAHTFSFNLENALNTSGQPVIQDVNQLSVVVLLINKDEANTVANANKARVSTPLGIGTVTQRQQQPTSVEYYDLSGRRLQQLQNGMNIIRYHFADGTSRTEKVAASRR